MDKLCRVKDKDLFLSLRDKPAGVGAAMGARVAPIEIERLGVLVHEAISGRARLFHTSDHVFELASGVGVDAIEMLRLRPFAG